MEFSATQQCCATEPFPALEQHPNDATPMMHSGSTLPSHAQTSQAQPLVSSQTTTGWTTGNVVQTSNASHRHTMMFVDSRPAQPEIKISRPLSMTAATMPRHLGFQNPRGEYLPQPHMPPPVVTQPKITQGVIGQHNWLQQKSYGDLDFTNLESELPEYGSGALGMDDDSTIIDLRKFANLGRDQMHDMFLESSRRMSESTNSMSSHSHFADLPHFDDSPPSDNPYAEVDWSGLDFSSRSHLDPTSSPRPPSLIRSASRSRVSPAPSLRSSPYTLESTRNKRWSTGMYPGQPPPRSHNVNRYSSYFVPPPDPQHGFSPFGPNLTNTLPAQNYLLPSTHYGGSSSNMLYPTSDLFPEAPRPLPSQGMFRLLQSNADRLPGCYSACADLSDPPDLYSTLSETPAEPPEEDMKPSDPDMVPHEQELRFPGDLYTPKWVRGQGNKREGWCGLCKPGRWLVLKNSAFWYDKSFTHGVSAATGAAFQSPQDTRRTEGNLDVWEGLCGSCNDWIALVSSKKKGTTWFRHAYKCHTHPKVKDGPKRRRDAVATTSRSDEPMPTSEPIITISSGTPEIKEELPIATLGLQPPESSTPMKGDASYLDVKIEDEATPVSTPQLSHTSLSTPQFGSMGTPNFSYPTPSNRKRFSVVFDNTAFTQSFSNNLQAFAEHEAERTPTHNQEMMQAIVEQPPTSSYTEPTFTFNNDGTFTQMTPTSSIMERVNSTATTDHFMTDNAITNNFFDFQLPPSQPQEPQPVHKPDGNWF